MTSPRGVKFLFQPGETVLCFEPDPSKARVLYQAKILEQTSSRNSKGNRKSEYQIHFQGWNHSWDRVVPESFVLKNSLENRQLMRKLAQIARHTGRNKDRMRKIDNILKVHRKKPKFDSESSDTTSEEGEDGGNTTAETEEEVTTSDQDLLMATDEEEEEEEVEQNGMPQDASDEEEPDLDKLEASLEAKEVVLELPSNLKKKLEEDFNMVNKRRKLLKLPANPNIVTILEGYVKNFGINVLCATVEKQRPTREHWHQPPPEKNVELCKEVMDGIRVFFDFTLPAVLLYNFERAQYAKITTTYKPKADLSLELKTDQEEQNTRLRTRISLSELQTEGSPKHRHSPRAKKKEEKEQSSEDEEEEAVPPPRRMTRHTFAEECQKSPKPKGLQSPTRHSRGSHSQDSAPEPDSDQDPAPPPPRHHDPAPRRGRGRGRGRPPAAAVAAAAAAAAASHDKSAEPDPPPPGKKLLADRVTPPLPLQLPGSVSSHCSSGQQSPTTSSAAEFFLDQSRRKEEAVNDICNWKLVPDELYSAHPTPPSIVYGAQHLLRLFVKLPELLSQMPMTDTRRKHLVKHLELFVEYMENRADELFNTTSSQYVDME